MIECEVKLKIENTKEIIDKLSSLGFVECDQLTEIDTYFDNKDNYIRDNDSALRVRETVNHTTNQTYSQINFKGKRLDEKTMSRPEYESEVDAADTMIKILECLGYKPVTPQVKKSRRIMRAASLTACVDSVEGLGDFLELEVIVETEKEKEKELIRIEDILSNLGYSISDTTTTSYLSALQLVEKR